MSGLEVTIARPEDKRTLVNLMQFYIHDFSEHWSGTANAELESDGRFAEYPLDDYWRNPSHVPLLLRLNNRLVGFALINRTSHSGRPLDYNMAEFFIVRKHRRSRVGTDAAHAIFSRYPGVWESAVARRNTGALAFWRKAVQQHPFAEDVEESDFNSSLWNGPILRFRIKPS